MFRKKLRALNYHSPDQEFPLESVEDLKPLVVWLEDQKIRQHKIEERTPLRRDEGKEWVETFRKYLKTLECPYRLDTDPHAVVDWLLGVAVRYEFGELAESTPEVKRPIGQPAATLPAPHQASQQQQQQQQQQGPLGRLVAAQAPPSATPTTTPTTRSALDVDPSDPVFISGTQALAKILKITTHPDPSVLLEAIRIVIEDKLSAATLSEAANSDPSAAAPREAKKYSITAKECGFDLGDPVLSEAAKVLRLLHLQELRHLQTHINELIVAVQALTANPKTDQSLGQVGR